MQADPLSGRISISAAEGAAHGLAPVTIEFDSSKTGLIGVRFPAPNLYLRMSGPPGGPCRLEIEWIPARPNGAVAPAEDLARRHDVPGNRFQPGRAGTIEIAGGVHPAFSWRIQPTPWAEHLTGILIVVPRHRGGLWLVAPGEGELTGPPRVAQHYLKIVRTFAIRTAA